MMPAPMPPMLTPLPMIIAGGMPVMHAPATPMPMPLTRPTVRRDRIEPRAPDRAGARHGDAATSPSHHAVAGAPHRGCRRRRDRDDRHRGRSRGTLEPRARRGRLAAAAAAGRKPGNGEWLAANTPPPRRSIAPQPPPRPAVIADVAPARDDESAETATGAPTFGTGPCKIAVSTTPAGSIISVDGEVAGPSPITIGGPCAKRKLDIAHPRYAPATRLVTATPDAAPIDIALARPTHDLYVETSPSGAIVSIDGHRAGTSPTLVKIMGFTALTLRIEKFGFAPTTQRIYSKSPRDRVNIRLGH